MIAVIEGCGCLRGMLDRMRAPETRQDERSAAIVVPAGLPDIYSKIVDVARPAESLADPRDRDDAAGAIRGPIKRKNLMSGNRFGAMPE